MDWMIMLAQLLLSLSFLVAVHEMGHLLAAKYFGMRVEQFSVGFPPKIWSFRKGDTEYAISAIPLGGYVKISGMIDESMDTEAMKLPPQPWEFRSKPAWQRLIVMVAGVTMNVILGIAIYTFVLLHYNKQYLSNDAVTDGIYAYELGEKIGLRTGDKIIAINGKPIERFEELLSIKVIFGVKLTVQRDGQNLEIVVPDDFYRDVSKAGQGNFLST